MNLSRAALYGELPTISAMLGLVSGKEFHFSSGLHCDPTADCPAPRQSHRARNTSGNSRGQWKKGWTWDDGVGFTIQLRPGIPAL